MLHTHREAKWVVDMNMGLTIPPRTQPIRPYNVRIIVDYLTRPHRTLQLFRAKLQAQPCGLPSESSARCQFRDGLG